MNGLHPNPVDLLARLATQRRPRPELDTPFAPPTNATEQMIADCWAEVLGLRQVGTHDNFFNLGGDSLHMTQIASRVRERCGVELPMTQFFTTPTVAGLASFVAGIRKDGERPSTTLVAESTTVHVTVGERFNIQSSTRPTNASPVSRGVISTIVIPTAERPAALQRCLSGLARNLQRYERAPRILVIDGSHDPRSAAANREAIATLTREYPLSIGLADGESTRAFASRLAQAGFDRELITFALPGADEFRLGSRLGASRNLHLLATAGEGILSVDDDTDCQFTSAPGVQSGPARDVGVDATGDDPAEVWVYRDRRTLLTSLPFSDVDLIGSHEELLGRRVGDLPSTSAHPTSNAQVRITLGGLAGDCGWGTPSRYLFIDDASFGRLAASDDIYRAAVTSREMLRAAPSWLVSGRTENLIAATFAADNRATLPPFVPVGRGSDVVFGRLLKQAEPTAAFGHLPWAILHEPIEQRRFSPGEILRSSATTDLKGMFCDLLAEGAAKENATPEEMLTAAGRRLVEIGTQSVADLEHMLVERRQRQIGAEIEFLEHRKATLGSASPQCQRDLEAYAQSLRQSRGRATSAVPAELLYGRELPIALHLARRIVTHFGHLLCAWPHLIAEAKHHLQTGAGPFRSL